MTEEMKESGFKCIKFMVCPKCGCVYDEDLAKVSYYSKPECPVCKLGKKLVKRGVL